jgi:hypothetical protein
VPTSTITGDIGVSPNAAVFLTGFSLAMDPSGKFSTSSQLTGKAFAADYTAAPTPVYLTTAIGDMQTAYNDASVRTTTDPSRKDVGSGNVGGNAGGLIGGLTFNPGVYTFSAGVSISSDITFEGGPDDVFIIQIETSLYQSMYTHVLLKGGAQAKNIYWRVKTYVFIGANASMQGTLLVAGEVDMLKYSTLNGSILTKTRVDLRKATITRQDTCTGTLAA